MGKTFQIKNKFNGVQSGVTQKEWEDIQAHPEYKTTFVLVEEQEAPEPKEVTELKAKKNAEPEAKKDGNGK